MNGGVEALAVPLFSTYCHAGEKKISCLDVIADYSLLADLLGATQLAISDSWVKVEELASYLEDSLLYLLIYVNKDDTVVR